MTETLLLNFKNNFSEKLDKKQNLCYNIAIITTRQKYLHIFKKNLVDRGLAVVI